LRPRDGTRNDGIFNRARAQLGGTARSSIDDLAGLFADHARLEYRRGITADYRPFARRDVYRYPMGHQRVRPYLRRVAIGCRKLCRPAGTPQGDARWPDGLCRVVGGVRRRDDICPVEWRARSARHWRCPVADRLARDPLAQLRRRGTKSRICILGRKSWRCTCGGTHGRRCDHQSLRLALGIPHQPPGVCRAHCRHAPVRRRIARPVGPSIGRVGHPDIRWRPSRAELGAD
jgi:hypothetical protein